MGDNTIRTFSSARSALDREHSQGKGVERRAKELSRTKSDLLLPPVVELAFCESHSRDWGVFVTIHYRHPFVHVRNVLH